MEPWVLAHEFIQEEKANKHTTKKPLKIKYQTLKLMEKTSSTAVHIKIEKKSQVILKTHTNRFRKWRILAFKPSLTIILNLKTCWLFEGLNLEKYYAEVQDTSTQVINCGGWSNCFDFQTEDIPASSKTTFFCCKVQRRPKSPFQLAMACTTTRLVTKIYQHNRGNITYIIQDVHWVNYHI